jgi:hypothetical protein
LNPRPLGYEDREASFNTGQYRARLSGIARQQSGATHRLCATSGQVWDVAEYGRVLA